MKTKELIDLIASKYPIYSLCEVDDLIKDKVKKVSNQQDSKKIYINKVNESKWYIVATNVYQCDDGYVGITGPCQLYNEQIAWKDINFPCEAFEYDEVYSISYVRKSEDKVNKSTELTTTTESLEKLISTLLSSKNIDGLTPEAIKHIKNIFKEVSELDKINFVGSAYPFVAMLLMFMNGNTFNENKEENNFQTK